MANYATLKAAISAAIKQNGNNEITGTLLQQQLLAMVNSLGAGYQFMGVATTSTNPGTPDQNVFYLALEPGTYTNFSGTVINDGEIGVFAYNGAWSISRAVVHKSVGALVATVANSVSGAISTSNGQITTSSGDVACTEYYPTFPGALILFKNPNGYQIETCIYDKNKAFISGGANWFSDKSYYVVPENAYYIRFAFRLSGGITPQTVFAQCYNTFNENAKIVGTGLADFSTSGRTLTFSSNMHVAYNNKLINISNQSLTFYDSSASALRTLVFDRQTETLKFVNSQNCVGDYIALGVITFVNNILTNVVMSFAYSIDGSAINDASLTDKYGVTIKMNEAHDGAIIDLSNNTITFPSGTIVNYGKQAVGVTTSAIEIVTSGSAIKYLIFDTADNTVKVVPIDQFIASRYKIIGTFLYSGGIPYYDFPFNIFITGAGANSGVNKKDDAAILKFANSQTDVPNFDLTNLTLSFVGNALVVYGRTVYNINYTCEIPTDGSSLKFLVFNKITKKVEIISSNLQISLTYIVLGWFIYGVNYGNPYIGSYNLPFPFTVNGYELNSPNAKVNSRNWLQFLDVIKYQGHFFMEYINQGSLDPIFPSETIFDIQFCKRVGVRSIEANTLATGTPGKNIVMHGDSAKIGYQLMLKKESYEANPSAYPNAVYDATHDAYYNPDVVIGQTSFDELRNNYFNRSVYPKYRVPITDLEEFLKQCKTLGIFPIVTYTNDAEIDLVNSIMGNYYAIRAGERHGDVLHIYWDGTVRTKEQIIALCNSFGKPFMYGMGTSVARQHTDAELKEIVDAVHQAGYFIVFDGNYYAESDNQRLFGLNFDGATTGWCVPDFDGNICNLSAEIDYDDFTHNGSVANNLLTLQNGNTIVPNFEIPTEFISKGLLKITFNGTINLTFGKASGEFSSDGTRELVFSSTFISGRPTFTITSVGVTSIINIHYSASKC